MIYPLYNRPNMRQLYDLNLKGALPLLALLFFGSISFSQQVADINYNPEIPQPEYAPGEGPVVFIDEGHHNFHTKNGRYKSFSSLLERDGYHVEEYNDDCHRRDKAHQHQPEFKTCITMQCQLFLHCTGIHYPGGKYGDNQTAQWQHDIGCQVVHQIKKCFIKHFDFGPQVK